MERRIVRRLRRSDRPLERARQRALLVLCASPQAGLDATFWTRERIIEAIKSWALQYGEPPAMNDWSPNRAIVYMSDLARARRAEQLIAERRIPWFSSVVARFGSWNAAIAAAGFATRTPGGGDGNQGRRRTTRKPSAVALEAVPPLKERDH